MYHKINPLYSNPRINISNLFTFDFHYQTLARFTRYQKPGIGRINAVGFRITFKKLSLNKAGKRSSLAAAELESPCITLVGFRFLSACYNFWLKASESRKSCLSDFSDDKI